MVPRALRIVAVIHLLFGLQSALGIVYKALVLDTVHVDFGVLGIPIYFGLLRFSNEWRTAALAFLWVTFIATPVLFFIGLFASAPAQLALPGVFAFNVSSAWLSVAAVPVFLLALWQYRVLTRADIKLLFGSPGTRPLSGAAPSP